MKFVHVWFSTKYRRAALENPNVASVALATIREVAARTNVDIVEMQTAIDHMHLLLRLRDDQKLPVVMHDLKGASSRAVHTAEPGLQLDMGTSSLWQKGYGSRILGAAEVEKVRRYIRTQMERPLRHG